MARPFLSIVIPAFNEESRIVATLEKVAGHLSRQPYSWEVVVVDDGSSDATAALASQWARSRQEVRVESVPHGGKGWAVRHGMLAAAGEHRFLCDADLAMPIEGLDAFLQRMGEGYHIVIGSRQLAGARRFNEPAVRHLLGRGFNWAVRLLAVGAFQDTQCGFKCFRGEVADELFVLQRTKGFGFDVEILYLALRRGWRVLEVPIDWHHQRDSKVRAGLDSFLMLRDILLVRWHDLRGMYKAKPAAPGEGSAQAVGRVEGSRPGAAPRPGAGELVVAVVPTYNEAANLPELADRLFALGIPNARLIVVDDSSPDGTAEVARKLSQKFDGRVDLIQRRGKLGLGTAYVEGFTLALAKGADYIVQMDADLSHAPEYIPSFLEALGDADVVVGSRYVPGGGAARGWGLRRRWLSSLANLGIRTVAGLKTKDATSGFKAFRGKALRSIELAQLRCRGFGFQAEMAHACQRHRYRVIEYPIVFEDRGQGRSKMSLAIAFEAFWRLLWLRWRS